MSGSLAGAISLCGSEMMVPGKKAIHDIPSDKQSEYILRRTEFIGNSVEVIRKNQ